MFVIIQLPPGDYLTTMLAELQSQGEGAQTAKRYLDTARHVTVVADRESDIYEEWERLPEVGFDLLTRACRDRALAGGGYIAGYGSESNLRIFDQFQSNDRMIRGFEYNGIGPYDNGTDDKDHIGGTTYLNATLEAQFPVPVIPESFGLRGAVSILLAVHCSCCTAVTVLLSRPTVFQHPLSFGAY